MKITAPHPHVDAKRKKKKVYNNKYEETYETFRRAYTVKKGDVDHAAPKHMNRFIKNRKS